MLTDFQAALLFSALAGATIPLGAGFGVIERLRPRWLDQELRHSVIAFGGGVLLAAVAFVLAPEGANRLPAGAAAVSLLAGGFAFFLLDRMIERRGGSFSQLIAMVADFLPEAMALGAIFATAEGPGPLLALLIARQNFPEGFNAYRELRDQG